MLNGYTRIYSKVNRVIFEGVLKHDRPVWKHGEVPGLFQKSFLFLGTFSETKKSK